MSDTFLLDGLEVPFEPGQSVIDAAAAAGVYIPFLCHHPSFPAHGSCKVCTVRVNGRTTASCTTPAAPGMVVESATEDLVEERRTIVQLLFTEGNHFCPSCEQSGKCTLQAVARELDMAYAHFNPLFPDRPVDASHPEILLDFNRCILCELCVRASREIDGKSVFALAGRGIGKHLVVNAESGRLGDTSLAATDAAASICPVGVILRKRHGFEVPIGERPYDRESIAERTVRLAREGKDEP